MITLKLKDLNDNAKLKPGATIKVKAITMTTPGRWTVTGEVTKTTSISCNNKGCEHNPSGEVCRQVKDGEELELSRGASLMDASLLICESFSPWPTKAEARAA